MEALNEIEYTALYEVETKLEEAVTSLEEVDATVNSATIRHIRDKVMTAHNQLEDFLSDHK